MIKNNLGVAVIGSKQYAVNLLWGSSQDTETTNQALNKSLTLMSSKLYSVIGRFQGEQFAVGDKNIGHKRGQVTLLSAIDFDGSSFCGLFPADNELWLVIGVDKDGMVHFDKSFHSKDDAKKFFFDHVAYGYPWDRTYSPSDVGVGESRSISELSLIKGKKLKEKGAGQLMPLLLSGVGIIIFFVIIYNFMNLWLSGRDKDILNEEPSPAVSEEVRNIPWEGKSKPGSLFSKCIKEMDSFRFQAASVPGWMPENKVTCNDSDINFSVYRSGGLNIWYENPGLFFHSGDIPDITRNDNDKITFTWPLETVRYDSSILDVHTLNKTQEIIRYLSRQFENSWIEIKFEPSVPDGNTERVGFSFSFNHDPRILLPILSEVNGLIITNIDYDFSGSNWNVKGVFWGRA
ncbi:Uncharacterised protein [Escherichia coli]|uniref:BfpC n=7 Tax=Escherichia coli TaxID=562 RepID=Q57029_ECOLX|nr:bundle-forming pilus protein BfpC [Escherichia coli]EHU03734.1 hypothetical protein ECDEC1B_5368 [Escherichia coli DEC1B]EHU34671.1 hypothetical protein ECDEC2C_5453 [Escherichia coli DEC2C]EHU47978.1 hypothetical protein ECDEC2E_5288 [Escherichia coli DEC2E]EHX27056.1 hypothetical protein ECDEC12B_2804 [Escherichia coli DEC12B]EHX39749.1 bfpC [Escherichia coli DEC12C]EIQ69255.1 hypothetical protein ECEPECC34262_3408 [Escherichia coli EPEC C342-62]